MSDDTTIAFVDPTFADTLTDLMRDGAHQIIRQALHAELGAFLQVNEETRKETRETPGQNKIEYRLTLIFRLDYRSDRVYLQRLRPGHQ